MLWIWKVTRPSTSLRGSRLSRFVGRLWTCCWCTALYSVSFIWRCGCIETLRLFNWIKSIIYPHIIFWIVVSASERLLKHLYLFCKMQNWKYLIIYHNLYINKAILPSSDNLDRTNLAPLHTATSNDNVPVVTALMEAGADPNLHGIGGATALHIGVRHSYMCSKVVSDWICLVTSQFTKLFYCELKYRTYPIRRHFTH